jgi:hypothetical protein
VDKKEHASAMGAMRDIVNIFNLTRKTKRKYQKLE